MANEKKWAQNINKQFPEKQIQLALKYKKKLDFINNKIKTSKSQ